MKMSTSAAPRKEILIHFPFPYFNSDQLVRSLWAHRAWHAQSGTFIPDPKLYQPMAKSCLASSAPEGGAAMIAHSLLAVFPTEAQRMVLSFPGVPNGPSDLFGSDGLMPGLSRSASRIRAAFRGFRLTFLFGMVNQGELLGSLIKANVVSKVMLETALQSASTYWSDAIGACRDEFPDINVVTWKHEDSEFLWPEIIASAVQGNPAVIRPGSFDMLTQSLSEDGVIELRKTLRSAGKISPENARDIIGYFSSSRKFARGISRRVDLPYWSDDIRSAFDERYAEDIQLLSQDAKITFLTPAPLKTVLKEPVHARNAIA